MYNKVIIIGHITRDIELKDLTSGMKVAKGSIASNHSYKTKTGEKKDETCFLEFDVFGKSAETLNQYVSKGNKVLLEGRLVLQQWTAQDGTKRSKHSLNVESFKFMESKADSKSATDSYSEPQAPQQQPQPQAGQYKDDEIPF